METGGWSLGADKAATQLIGRPSKYLTSVKNFNMNYPRKQGNTQPCGNYESAFWPILKVHNFYMSVSLKIQTVAPCFSLSRLVTQLLVILAIATSRIYFPCSCSLFVPWLVGHPSLPPPSSFLNFSLPESPSCRICHQIVGFPSGFPDELPISSSTNLAKLGAFTDKSNFYCVRIDVSTTSQ